MTLGSAPHWLVRSPALCPAGYASDREYMKQRMVGSSTRKVGKNKPLKSYDFSGLLVD